MRHLALFNGIGGFQLAAHWMGWLNVAHVEIDPFCNKVVKKHFPESKCYEDIKEFDGKPFRGAIDIISGGFPCQPYSNAGKRLGKEDDRHLWPEMLRVIREVSPSFVVGENVVGLLNWNAGLVFEEIQIDLENEGYEIQPIILPACSIGPPHQRNRIWFIANSKSKRWVKMEQNKPKRLSEFDIESCNEAWRYSSDLLLRMEPDWSRPSLGVVRNDHGLSEGVDRLKSLGNAIVPQVAYQIFKAIEEFNNLTQ